MRNNLLQTVDVDSTAIQTAEYEYDSYRLKLTYQNGSAYDYFKVPKFVFEGLRSSKSKGKFINNYILRQYNFYKSL